jgi:hypothetical protein
MQQVSTLCVSEDLVAAGGFTGELVVGRLGVAGPVHSCRVTQSEINNSCEHWGGGRMFVGKGCRQQGDLCSQSSWQGCATCLPRATGTKVMLFALLSLACVGLCLLWCCMQPT